MYLEKLAKFGLPEFLASIFSSRPPSPMKDLQKTDDFVSFTQIDNLIAENMLVSEPDFPIFKTGNGQKIDIDQEKIDNALKLFIENDDFENILPSKKPEILEKDVIFLKNNSNNIKNDDGFIGKTPLFNDNKGERGGFTGFQTAKGGILNIKEQNLKEAEKWLSDEKEQSFMDKNTKKIPIINKNNLKEPIFSNNIKNNDRKNENNGFSGFQTGKGGVLNIKEQNLKKAELLLSEEKEYLKPKILKTNEKKPEFKEKVQIDQGFQGFKTAKGQIIDIDDKRLEIIEKSLFSEENEEKPRKNIEKITKNEVFSGFQTAKGNSILVDEKNMKEAEILLEEKSEKTEKNQKKSDIFDKKPEKSLHQKVIPKENEKKPDIFEKKLETPLFPKKNGKITEKIRFLDFKNKKTSPKKQENLQKQRKTLAKSSERLKISRPTSKMLYTGDRSHKNLSFFDKVSNKPLKSKEKELKKQKRNIEEFETEQEIMSFSRKKTNAFRKELDFNNFQKSPNLIFSLQAKNLINNIISVKKTVKLNDLMVVKIENANRNFEINENQAGSYNFICDCVTFSQSSNEKCLCNGKLIITNEFFFRFLNEKFPKIAMSEVKKISKGDLLIRLELGQASL